MNNKYIKFLNRVFNIKIIYYFDLILFTIIICYLVYNILCVVLSLTYMLLEHNCKEFIFNMVEINNLPSSSSTHTTNVTIIQDDGGWGNAIRQIFIYGSGALRFNLIRNGTPGSKGFVIATTLLADGISKAINKTLNDPDYVLKHAQNWKKLWESNDSIRLEIADETSQIFKKETIQEPSVDFHSLSNLNDVTDKLFDMLMGNLKTVLEPVTVTYSNELLLQQIHGLSILLFVLSILIIGIFIVYIINTLVLLYSDRILNYFKNKYIRAYLNLQAKIITIELIFLSGTIVYFLYNIAIGAQFIARHPINFT